MARPEVTRSGRSALRRARGALHGDARSLGRTRSLPDRVDLAVGLLIPVSGLASGTLLLGEALAHLQAAGVLLVFAGLAESVYGAQLRAWLTRAG